METLTTTTAGLFNFFVESERLTLGHEAILTGSKSGKIVLSQRYIVASSNHSYGYEVTLQAEETISVAFDAVTHPPAPNIAIQKNKDDIAEINTVLTPDFRNLGSRTKFSIANTTSLGPTPPGNQLGYE